MTHAFIILLCRFTSSFKVGVSVMVNNDRLGDTSVLDSSLVYHTAGK
jgi:hypothetical protein